MGKVRCIPGLQKEEWGWETLLLMPNWLFCIRATVNGLGHAENWRSWVLSVHANHINSAQITDPARGS